MLKNMTALVIGGGGSLGLATAKKLVSEGCRVMVMDLAGAKEKVLQELGKEANFSDADVTSETQVQEVVGKVELTFGGLNVLVNCAGIARSRQVYNVNKNTTASLSEFEELLRVNVLGTYNAIRLAVPLMVKNQPDEDGLRGLVINTSGFYAFDGQIGQSGLSASAGAVASMTLPLCRDLAPMGIRVMAIAPGVMNSNLTNFLPKKVTDHLSLFTPSPKRLGAPEEYAHLVKSIIENKFLNGETIRLDGGLRMYLN